MKVVKVINNNLVRSYEKGTEVLVTGSGIGFQKKPGDEIDPSRIEKVYRISDQGIESRLAQIVDQIPGEL
ncbi:MAG: CAT RNA binding domain-containing protein [Bulleidia sp.]